MLRGQHWFRSRVCTETHILQSALLLYTILVRLCWVGLILPIFCWSADANRNVFIYVREGHACYLFMCILLRVRNLVSLSMRQRCTTSMYRLLLVSAECQYDLWCVRGLCSTHTCQLFEREFSMMNVVVGTQHNLANQCIIASAVYGLTVVWHTYIVDPTSTRVYARPCSFSVLKLQWHPRLVALRRNP